ncbi:MAG: hypothetical protein JNK30_22920 [Phenylobacterium sp.]|uniref:hypothetical protein n=1 Tax=Phenylobacterium sp. TaxID=1871053 RepID=UPI001A60613A|nr:hypothetical protein [Phenylobacterium sp.]MBL8774260.1 hypothetical protein [Phenylobacterium sp.]
MVGVAFVVVALDWGRQETALRERAYPIPQPECSSDAECAEKALQVQAREAATAEAALEVAVFQLALSLAGVIAVGFTIFYAHRAWKEAERSADAAHESLQDARDDAVAQAARFSEELEIARQTANAALRQVAVAEDTAQKELRAYVTAVEASIGWGPNHHPLITLRCVNTGRTPATRMYIGGFCYLADSITDVGAAQRPKYRFGKWSAVGAGSEEKAIAVIEGIEAITKTAVSASRLLVIEGSIKYVDIFDEVFESEFAFFCMRAEPPESQMAIVPGDRPTFRHLGKAN